MSPKVGQALSSGQPVVALESSIIAQGLPYPDNIETALAVEQRVVDADAVPATIAVLNGRIRIGLCQGDIETLATQPGILKLSRNGIAAAIADGRSGATTVAATMICAHAAGIDVFATGGIGGVHRFANRTFDVSSDLRELAETPMVVVASGAKSILDIPKTLEVLETLGVPVISVGQDEFPAFWSRSSGVRAQLRIDEPERIAALHLAREQLGLRGGILVASPIREGSEICFDVMQPWIEDAVNQATALGIAGKDVTPFLLSSVAEASGNETIKANKILVQDNATLAARIAKVIVAST